MLAAALLPLGSQLTLGATLGYASGQALRVAGRVAAGKETVLRVRAFWGRVVGGASSPLS